MSSILVVVIILAVSFYFLSNRGKTVETKYSDYNELKALIESKSKAYLLLDVRTPAEYAAGHIPTAVNIPYQNLPGAIPEGTAKDKTIIIYCQGGVRSRKGAGLLNKAGYTDIHDFGAIDRWQGKLER